MVPFQKQRRALLDFSFILSPGLCAESVWKGLFGVLCSDSILCSSTLSCNPVMFASDRSAFGRCANQTFVGCLLRLYLSGYFICSEDQFDWNLVCLCIFFFLLTLWLFSELVSEWNCSGWCPQTHLCRFGLCQPDFAVFIIFPLEMLTEGDLSRNEICWCSSVDVVL